MTPPFTVTFTKSDDGMYESWDMDAETIELARELAEDYVDSHDADRAEIWDSALLLLEWYVDGDWTGIDYEDEDATLAS
jgi:hypothetical protein